MSGRRALYSQEDLEDEWSDDDDYYDDGDYAEYDVAPQQLKVRRHAVRHRQRTTIAGSVLLG